MERNSELFFEVADQIRRHPETYNQTTYVSDMGCGTAYCIAGWAIVLSGEQVGNHCSPGLRAAELLGLSRGEWSFSARGLFHETWRPKPPLTVPEALEKLGAGASMDEVTAP